jgi:hypothetical protein
MWLSLSNVVYGCLLEVCERSHDNVRTITFVCGSLA